MCTGRHRASEGSTLGLACQIACIRGWAAPSKIDRSPFDIFFDAANRQSLNTPGRSYGYIYTRQKGVGPKLRPDLKRLSSARAIVNRIVPFPRALQRYTPSPKSQTHVPTSPNLPVSTMGTSAAAGSVLPHSNACASPITHFKRSCSPTGWSCGTRA